MGVRENECGKKLGFELWHEVIRCSRAALAAGKPVLHPSPVREYCAIANAEAVFKKVICIRQDALANTVPVIQAP